MNIAREYPTPTVLPQELSDVEVFGRESSYPQIKFHSLHGLENYIEGVAQANFDASAGFVFGLIEADSLDPEDVYVEEMVALREMLFETWE